MDHCLKKPRPTSPPLRVKRKYRMKDSPTFDPFDSTPLVDDTNEPYHLKLCFCPLCQRGMKGLAVDQPRNVVSWQFICKVIYYCLYSISRREEAKNKKDKQYYFSIKQDVNEFIVNHWYLFGRMSQFRTNPSKWKKAMLDALIHSDEFKSGKEEINKPGMWRMLKYTNPWEDVCVYSSSMKDSLSASDETKQSNYMEFGMNCIPSYVSDGSYSLCNSVMQASTEGMMCRSSPVYESFNYYWNAM